MKICPACHEEYLDHIEMCAGCQAALVHENDAFLLSHNDASLSKEELLKGETVAFLEGSIGHCREFEKLLLKSQIPCAVYPKHLSCESTPQTLGSACDMKYILLISPNDIEGAKKALMGQFHEQVAKEGQGELTHTEVDLSHETITCPCCGEHGSLNNGECQSCGLFLGVIDPEQEKSN